MKAVGAASTFNPAAPGAIGGTTPSAGTFTSDSAQHFIGTTAAPTFVVGTGAGTTPTITITGNDFGMTINVTTGTLPAASATIVTVTFAVPYSTAPRVYLSPHNSAASALTALNQITAAGETATTFTMTSGSTALAAATAYSWNVMVTG